MKRINEVRKKLLDLGFDITCDKIRSLEKKGLFESKRSEAGQRVFDQDNINLCVTNIILYEMGVSIGDIVERRKEVIEEKLKSIEVLLQSLS